MATMACVLTSRIQDGLNKEITRSGDSGRERSRIRVCLPLSSGSVLETELERIFDALDSRLATETSEPDSMIHLLSAVLVANIKHDALFTAIKQKPEGDTGEIACPDTQIQQLKTH